MQDNLITIQHNILVLATNDTDDNLEYLKENICGCVVYYKDLYITKDKILYLCGDISKINVKDPRKVYVVKEYSYNYDSDNFDCINFGRIPILIKNSAVYYREFFKEDDYYNKINTEHKFQTLTESNKDGSTHKTGIHLSEVKRNDNNGIKFNLMRCSTNFEGPTDNFRVSDREIIDSLNDESKNVFTKEVTLNHVLAQKYHNIKDSDGNNMNENKNSAHSDKTNDMRRDAVMAFCTFYDKNTISLKKKGFDYVYKGVSCLTKISFVLKESIKTDPKYIKLESFDVTLYPNSVLIIPLSTNRFFTHEIKPTCLDFSIPSRMGYVVRCSSTEAIHLDGKTYLIDKNTKRPLEKMTDEGIKRLRYLYREENITADIINYEGIDFSMNEGDYISPLLE